MTEEVETPVETYVEPAAVAQDAPEAAPAVEVAVEPEPVYEAPVAEEAPVEQAPVEAPVEEAPVEQGPAEVAQALEHLEAEVEAAEEVVEAYVNHNARNGVQAGPAPHPRTV